MDYIMGSHTVIAMGIMEEVDIHKVNGVYACISKEAYN